VPFSTSLSIIDVVILSCHLEIVNSVLVRSFNDLHKITNRIQQERTGGV
jgi:hypothetical protein